MYIFITFGNAQLAAAYRGEPFRNSDRWWHAEQRGWNLVIITDSQVQVCI